MADRELVVRISAEVSNFQRETRNAEQSLQRLGREAQSTGQSTATMGRAQSMAAQGMDRHAQSAGRAQVGLGQYTSATTSASRASDGLTRSSESQGTSLAKRALQYTAVGAAIGVVGGVFRSTISAGVDYQSSLNTLQAVSGATADKMAQVSTKARALGNDISIPGASASTAAAAMTELAKGGLSVDQAMAAAKGTLQLATAAQIDGAAAATIQAKALNTFGLSGSDASHVADVLANTANAASGEIGDFALAMSQGGLVAHGMGVSIDDTATALGIFANQGLVSSDAGTSLKNMLVQMQSPTKQQAAALKTLGVTAFDANGKFVGMRTITGELSAAQKKLTQQQFDAAASTAYGTDSVRAAIAMASGGTKAYDQMAAAVSKQGGAALLAGAQTKGLKGAFNLVQNAVQDAQLSLMDKLGPALDSTTRNFAKMIPSITQGLVPGLASAGTAIIGVAQDGLPVLGSAATAAGGLIGAFGNILHTLGPVLTGIFGGISSVMGVFSKLPGPIGVAVIALGAMFLLRGKMNAFGTSVAGSVNGMRSSLTSFGLQMRTSAELATVNGARFPAMSAGLSGIGRAAGTAGRGLMGAFGGPIGLAIVGVTTVLSYFSAKSAAVKQRAEDQKAAIDSLASTYDKLTGSISGQTVAQIQTDLANNAADFKTLGTTAGAAAQAIVAGAHDGGKSWDEYRGKLAGAIVDSGRLGHISQDASTSFKEVADHTGKSWNDVAIAIAQGGSKAAWVTKVFTDMGLSTTDAQSRVNAMASELEAGGGKALADFRVEQDGVAGSSKKMADQLAAAKDAANVAAGAYSGQLSVAMQTAKSAGDSLEQSMTAVNIPAAQQKAILLALNDTLVTGGDNQHYLSQKAADAAVSLDAAGKAGTNASGAFTAFGQSVPVSALRALHDEAAPTAQTIINVDTALQQIAKSALATDRAGDFSAMQKSLKSVSDAASSADTQLQFFTQDVDKLAGINVSAEQTQKLLNDTLRGAEQGFKDNKQAITDHNKAVQAAKDDIQKYSKAIADGATGSPAAAHAQDRITAATNSLAAAERKLQALQDAGPKKHETQAHFDAAVAAAKDKVSAATRHQATAEGDLQRAQGKSSTQTQSDIKSLADAKAALAALNTEVLKSPKDLINSAAEFKRTGIAINTTTEAGSKLADSFNGYASAAQKATSNAYSNAVATGHSKDALKDAQAAADGARGKFIEMAKAQGLTTGQANTLANELGILDGKKLHNKDFGVTAKTQAANAAVDALNKKKADDKAIKVVGDARDALSKISAVDLAKLPTKTQKLIGDAIDAQAKIKTVTAATVPAKTAKLLGDATDAINKINAVKNTPPPTKKTVITGDNSDALQKIADAQDAVDGMRGRSIPITYSGQVGTVGKVTAVAGGGPIDGSGPRGVDSVLLYGAPGEHMWTDKETSALGGHEAMFRLRKAALAGQIPGFAGGGPIGIDYNITATNSRPPDFAALVASAGADMASSISAYLKAHPPAAPAAASSSGGGGRVPAASSGVAQWVPLMNKVIAAKLGQAAVSHIEPIMAAQMAQESSGNPAAINRTDINAQQGHPSVGLLQFIPSTFARFADPGYNTNIYDPESQMRAFVNYVPSNYGSFDYLTRIHNGPYAKGGYVNGPGTTTSDDVPAWLSNKEFVSTAVSTAMNRKALEFGNAGGKIPGFATGGPVSGAALAGVSPRQLGTSEGITVAAIAQLGDLITAWRQGASDASRTALASALAWRQAQKDQRATELAGAASLLQARQSAASALRGAQGNVNTAKTAELAAGRAVLQVGATGEFAQRAAEAARGRAEVRIGDAKAAQDRAKTRAQQVAADKQLATAQHDYNTANLADIRAKRVETFQQAATVAAQHRAVLALAAAQHDYNVTNVTGARAIQQAREQQVLANQVAYRTAVAARTQAIADQKAAVAAQARSDAETRAQVAARRAEGLLVSLSRQLDVTSTALQTNRDKLATLTDARAATVSSLSGSILGNTSGLTGFASERKTPADIIRGLQFDLAGEKSFSGSLSKDSKLGLSAASVQDLISKGADGVLTAATLSKGTRGQIAQVESLQKQITAQANFVAARSIDPTVNLTITALTTQITRQGQQIAALTKAMGSYAQQTVAGINLAAHAPVRALAAAASKSGGQY